MIDLTNYKSLKERKLIQFIKIGDAFAVGISLFNPSTGEKEKPEISSVDINELIKQRENLSISLSNLDEIIDTLKNLK